MTPEEKRQFFKDIELGMCQRARYICKDGKYDPVAEVQEQYSKEMNKFFGGIVVGANNLDKNDRQLHVIKNSHGDVYEKAVEVGLELARRSSDV
jgi:hypothetical protein